MKRTRIGGGCMVVGYSSGGGIWIRIGGGIWIQIGGGIWIRWWYTDTNRWYMAALVGYGSGGGSGGSIWIWIRSGGGRWQGR